jgi:predicted TIM-barrel fold metal-dependent hydrolase
VIVDAHTHIFPPSVIAQRAHYVSADLTFAELYGNPEAKLATREDLLRSMDEAGVDVSIALGFAWTDPETCSLQNDYLLEAAATSNGRIIAFPNLPLAARLPSGSTDLARIEAEARRCAAAGARGFGELRPDNLDFSLAPPSQPGDSAREAALLARLGAELDCVLLFHVSEPAGHFYGGKQGCSLIHFYDFVSHHPHAKVVGAHWGGGLPFYALMPEVRRLLASVRVDTAATSLLYDDSIYTHVVDLIGPETILFGSDYPLLSQARSRRRIEESALAPADRELILGANAAALLDLA